MVDTAVFEVIRERSFTPRGTTPVSNALSVTPALTDGVSLPLLFALAVAATVLVAIAARMRKLWAAGNLTVANTAVGSASAAFVVAGTILASMSLGTSAPASALDTQSQNVNDNSTVQGYELASLNELEGLQLPTE